MASITNKEEQYNMDMVETDNIKILVNDQEYYNATIGTGKEGKVTFMFQEQDKTV